MHLEVQKVNYTPKKVSQVQFTGLLPVKSGTSKLKQMALNSASDILDIRSEIIAPLIQGASKRRIDFLNMLVTRYNAKYYNALIKESPEHLIEIFNSVKKPKNIHFGILGNVHGSFEYISNVFKLAKDKNSLEFILNFDKNVFAVKGKENNILVDILESKNRNEYINNINDYKSYLRLNRKNENVIKDLDKLIDEGKYNASDFDKRYSAKLLLENKNLSKVFSSEEVFENYSYEGEKFLREFFNEYNSRNPIAISDVNKSVILDMFKSSNPENIDLRLNILRRFKYSFEDDEKLRMKELYSMKDLFKNIENDKNVKKLISVLFKDNAKIESIQELNSIINSVDPIEALVFHKNVTSIVSLIPHGKARTLALKNELRNPFFIPQNSYNYRNAVKYGFIEEEGKVTKFFKKIEYEFNKLKFSFLSKRVEKPVEQAESEVLRTVEEPKEISVKREYKLTIPKMDSISAPVEENVTPTLNLVRTLKESPKARKLKLKNDVNEIIQKRLGSSVYMNQKDSYSKNATKMRLKLLPEIFDSIKETRKIDRSVLKLKSLSSNKQALALYNKINGNNRKLIRYMLMKRDFQGSRMYEVNDIIKFIENAQNHIAKEKAKNPNFKAADAKAYYEHLYQVHIDLYGKLKNVRPKNNK